MKEQAKIYLHNELKASYQQELQQAPEYNQFQVFPALRANCKTFQNQKVIHL